MGSFRHDNLLKQLIPTLGIPWNRRHNLGLSPLREAHPRILYFSQCRWNIWQGDECDVKLLLVLFGLEDLEVTIERTRASHGELSCLTVTLHTVHKSIKLSKCSFFPPKLSWINNYVILFFCMYPGFYIFWVKMYSATGTIMLGTFFF